MTAVAEAPQAGTEAVSSPQSAVIGIIAGEGVQIGVLLDANAPVSVMVDPLLKVVNVRLRELGLATLEAKQRGRWALCLVDGTPLRALAARPSSGTDGIGKSSSTSPGAGKPQAGKKPPAAGF